MELIKYHLTIQLCYGGRSVTLVMVVRLAFNDKWSFLENMLTYWDNLYSFLVPNYCFQALKTLVREMKQKFSRRLAINQEPPHVFSSQDRSAVRFSLTLLSVYYAREA